MVGPVRLPAIVAGRRRWRLAALVCNGLCQGAATFIVSWSLHRLISELSQGADVLAMATLTGAAAALFALRWREGFDAESLGQDYVGRVRERLFSRIMALPLAPRQRYRYGTTMVRLTGDLTALKNWVSLGIARLVVSAISLLATLTAIAWFSTPAALIAGGIFALCVVVGMAATPALRRSVREARSQRGRLANRLGDRLLAAVMLRHLGRVSAERRVLRRDSRRMGRLLANRAAGFSALRALAELVLPLTMAGLVAFLAWRSAGLDLAQMAALAVLLGHASVAVRHAAAAWEYRLNFDQARARLKSILSLPTMPDRGDLILPEKGPTVIHCTDIRLWPGAAILSARLGSGERVLLSGASGVGKSTMLAVLARLAEPAEGAVEIDGHPIRAYTLQSVSQTIRLISPILPLIAGSVEGNIRLGRVAGSAVSVREIAKLCGLAGPGPGLDRGIRTRIHDGGRNLPDGLRARVLLARALASAPAVLLIDDPAFLVDTDAVRALRAALAWRPMTVVMAGDTRHDSIDATGIWYMGPNGLHETKTATQTDNVHPLPIAARHDHGQG